MKKWIWESPQYPNFKYQEQSFRDLLDNIEYNQNRLEILVKNETDKTLLNQKIDILTDEIADTSFIEGEILQRISVRDSIKKRLDDNFDEFGKNYSTKQTDNLASLLLDTNLNKSPLTIQRLHGWHNCLFEGGYNGLYKINIARFRKEEIEVVSGKIGKTKTYYQAIPFDRLEDSMEEFLHYCNHSTQNSYIKSALAHLWFVIIHPYDDGNGRIARAIADYLLPNKDIKLYSLSNQIKEHRKEYYEVLEKTTSYNDECDISNWLQWHLKITNLAIKKGINTLENIVKKTKFWDFYVQNNFNERQKKVINKILDIGEDNFKGNLNLRKYASIAKTDFETAKRDIDELIKLGCFKQEGKSYSMIPVIQSKEELLLEMNKENKERELKEEENNHNNVRTMQ
ncbi:hypothetical protein BA917_09105 [Helicobacter pullorum]|uniref:Fic family protein n=1 Tax=Helicobacter pullorum TaxID=35818 RepID=UPI0008168211|nr:DUF4172 domain-containing protein [Helicobacter pullorum]OCR18217.1 hypothetical protein BA917_09105 [Helicobacter pullorum]